MQAFNLPHIRKNAIEQAFFCAKPKNPVHDFQKPSSANFAETQLFSKNPVLKMAKLRFSEICRRDQHFFLNYSAICQVFAFIDTQMSLIASKLKSN